MKEKILKVSSKALATGTVFFSLASLTFADIMDPSTWLGDLNKQADGTIDTLIIDFLNWGIGFAAVLAVIMLVVAGIMYITANGDEQKIGKATKTLTFAIIGLVVCFIAVMLVNFVIVNFLNLGPV